MFGIYRAILAILVVFQHIAMVSFVGSAAVMGFFILSGYLMTYVMQRSYGYSLAGMGRFAINRCLRLFPAYWIVLVLSVAVILALGQEQVSHYRASFGIPSDLTGWAANVSMIYPSLRPSQIVPRISPATWALTIELLYYGLIALGTSRSRMTTWLFFAIGIGWHIYVVIGGLEPAWRYHFIGAGALPFAIGSLIYHYREALCARFSRPLPQMCLAIVLFAIAVGFAFLALLQGSATFSTLAFYLNLIAQTLMIISLVKLRIPSLMAFDRVAGDWSYHIYILHWVTGAVWAMEILGLDKPGRNLRSIIAAVLGTLTAIAISFLLTRLVDKPIKNLRNRIKQQAGSSQT